MAKKVCAANTPEALLALDRSLGSEVELPPEAYAKLMQSLPSGSILTLPEKTSIHYEAAYDQRQGKLVSVDKDASGSHVMKIEIKDGKCKGLIVSVPETYFNEVALYGSWPRKHKQNRKTH